MYSPGRTVLLLHRPHRSELSQEAIKTKATNPISYTGLVRIPFQRLIMNYHPDNGNGRAFSYNSINHALCPLPAESASRLIQKRIHEVKLDCDSVCTLVCCGLRICSEYVCVSHLLRKSVTQHFFPSVISVLAARTSLHRLSHLASPLHCFKVV